MKASLKNLSDNIAKANDQFYERNSKIDTVIGIMDKILRQQGMQADAVSIECIPLNKKIIFLMHDDKPLQVDIALGNREGDIVESSQCLLNELTVEKIVAYMSDYFK
ncbi:hypothetical protein ACLKMH_15455 [Psychromonas sp. KJ10-10]|uniref:hypothetical protein n=1 Tax=Psychromonas sp. KJ10-10 TaxID=3391823 RepID=UPI0039B67DE3